MLLLPWSLTNYNIPYLILSNVKCKLIFISSYFRLIKLDEKISVLFFFLESSWHIILFSHLAFLRGVIDFIHEVEVFVVSSQSPVFIFFFNFEMIFYTLSNCVDCLLAFIENCESEWFRLVWIPFSDDHSFVNLFKSLHLFWRNRNSRKKISFHLLSSILQVFHLLVLSFLATLLELRYLWVIWKF